MTTTKVHNPSIEELMETKQKTEVKALTGIRADEHNSISLKIMYGECNDPDGDLYISIEDSGEGASFFFDSVGELRAFLNRVAEQLRYHQGE